MVARSPKVGGSRAARRGRRRCLYARRIHSALWWACRVALRRGGARGRRCCDGGQSGARSSTKPSCWRLASCCCRRRHVLVPQCNARVRVVCAFLSALCCLRSIIHMDVRVPFIDAASPLSSALTPRSSPTAILHAAHERRTTWDDPSLIANAASSVADAASAPQDAAQDDAHGWVEHTDPESGGVYLVHSETHETRWP